MSKHDDRVAYLFAQISGMELARHAVMGLRGAPNPTFAAAIEAAVNRIQDLITQAVVERQKVTAALRNTPSSMTGGVQSEKGRQR